MPAAGVRSDRRRSGAGATPRAARRAPLALRAFDRLALPLLMRIVAGSAKGVRLTPVPPGVRPISDRAREGLFSSLGPGALEGADVLDLFAGTGAAGIEALSRGAARATFVDRAPAAVAAIKRNLDLTRLAARGEVHPAGVARFVAQGRPARSAVRSSDLRSALRSRRSRARRVFCGTGWRMGSTMASTVVLTRGHKSSTPVIPLHWAIARQLRYGDSLVILFRPRGSAQETA